jgi:monovalent cation:H+ antiporter, CPA1 family
MVSVMLALMSILFLSLLVYLISKWSKFPYTILLVLAGLLLIPLSRTETFGFLSSFELTPDLLFFVFLPTLVFESAYNINAKKMMESIRSISLLAVPSLLISTIIITFGLHYAMAFFGFDIPLTVTLLFGALISATDPVAVLALFKEYGAPKRLSLVFEGESLFNDGTSLALFLVILEILMKGWNGVSSISEGMFMFTSMVLVGVLFGGLMGALFSKMIEWVRGHEYVELTLTMVVAHLTFILSEMITHHATLFGHHLYSSSIIATVIAAMMVGNYGRYKISPKVSEYMELFWGYFAFLANSIIFVLIGLLFASLDIPFTELAIPVTLAIVVVMIARAISVYPVVGFLNLTKTEEHIPMSWQHLMAWGSLRGALAVTMVLLIPEDLTVAGWPYADISVRDYITAFTIACIYFTLFIKGLTIGPMIKALKLDALSRVEEAEAEEGRALVYAKVLVEVDRFLKKGYITEALHLALKTKYEAYYRSACQQFQACLGATSGVHENVLLVYATGVEKSSLKSLFAYNEVSETVYKRILSELNERSEVAELYNGEVTITDKDFEKDWLDKSYDIVTRAFGGVVSKVPDEVTLFMYYRARAVISQKVADELTALSEGNQELFPGSQDVFSPLIKRYRDMNIWAKSKTEEVALSHPALIDPIKAQFAEAGLWKAEARILHDLLEKEAISGKVHLLLSEELTMRTERVAQGRA